MLAQLPMDDTVENAVQARVEESAWVVCPLPLHRRSPTEGQSGVLWKGMLLTAD